MTDTRDRTPPAPTANGRPQRAPGGQPPELELPGPEAYPTLTDTVEPAGNEITLREPSNKKRVTEAPDDVAEPARNIDAERYVLGGMMLDAHVVPAVTALITGEDFYTPAHETIYDAVTALHGAGKPTNVIAVADQLVIADQLRNIGGAAYLHELIAATPLAENAGYFADIVRRHALHRRFQQAAARINQLAQRPTDDAIQALTAATLELTQVRERHLHGDLDPALAEDVFAFLAHAADDDPPEWIIDGILERGDRLIVTAGEGHGKSTLLRQIAVQSAAGIHPFTLEVIDPLRVLIVDLENSERQTRRELRPLSIQAGERLARDQLHIVCKIDGFDLGTAQDLAWLDRAIEQTRPDLLVTGPIYKMATGNPNEEKEAKPIAMGLDHLRARHGIAVILEAHSAKTPAGVNPRNRPKEPFGWSGWMRWPEFGLHLAEDGVLTAWRGGRDRHTRSWPDILNRGGRWPFQPADPSLFDTAPASHWLAIRGAIIQAGRRLTLRDLATETGISRSQVQRVLGAHEAEVIALYNEIEEAQHDQ